MDFIDDLAKLGNLLSEIYSICAECVIDHSVEEFVSDAEIDSSVPISSLSAVVIKDHVNDESDDQYENAITRVLMCFERAKPILKRIGKTDMDGHKVVVGQLTKKSVSSLTYEIYDLNDYVRMANRLIKNKSIDQSKRNELKLLQVLKDSFNMITISINEVLVEHNTYFKNDKSMQVNYVNLID
jgi:hypothetical protein